jgi:hypothetical protein
MILLAGYEAVTEAEQAFVVGQCRLTPSNPR